MAKTPQKPAPQQRRPAPPPPQPQPQQRRPAPPQPQRQAQPQPPHQQQRAQVPAVSAAANLPAHLRDRVGQSTGKGLSKDSADNLVPLIYVLQELSPQVNEREPAYISGATAGNFWLRGMDPPLVDGENEGMVVQSCHYNKCVIEWRPDRGGFAGRHDSMPQDAVQQVDPKDPNKTIWVNQATGNHYVETREHVVRVHLPDGQRVPFVLPFSSTGHTVSRAWMFDMNQKQLDGKPVDSFCLLYRLKTVYQRNAKGAWFKIDVKFEGWVQTVEDIDAGELIHNAFSTGEKEVDTTQYSDQAGDTNFGVGGAEDQDGQQGQGGQQGRPVPF